MTRDTTSTAVGFDPGLYPRCGCPPRPPDAAPWRDMCTWHVEHYRAASDGRGAHRKGHPLVCADMIDKWLDAMLWDREDRPASHGVDGRER